MIDTKTKVSDEDIKTLLDKQLNRMPSGTWIILYNGHQVTVRSGKSSWSTIGHAKTALKHHLNYDIDEFSSRVGDLLRYDKRVNEEIWERIKGFVEFKQLS